MWGFAVDVETLSPVYIKECISKTGHVVLIIVSQDPYGIKMYSTTFIDEIKEIYEGDEKLFYIEKGEVLNLEEEDVTSYSGLIDVKEIRKYLSVVLIDNDVEEVIKLSVKITTEGIITNDK